MNVDHVIGSDRKGISTHVNKESQVFTTTLDGDNFNHATPPEVEEPIISLNGTGRVKKMQFDASMLSTHIAMIGGIGMGKSNTFDHLIGQTIDHLNINDKMIIFDTKGDFLNDFKDYCDHVVISNDSRSTDYWNIFKEIDESDVEGSCRELANALFKEAIEKSSNPFFPTAACDIFYALLVQMHDFFEERFDEPPTNQGMMAIYNGSTPEDILNYLKLDTRFASSIASYISDPKSGQSQGVIAELYSVLNKIFVGNFNKKGSLALTDIVKEPGKKIVFIEYDIKKGETLSPIYSLMVDQALKQALSNTSETDKHSVYLFVDEFKLLPNLTHIDDAVNFGRSLGVKVIIALQSITQMYDSYGEMKAKSILSGFLNYFFFNVNNKESRDFIREKFGECLRQIRYPQQSGVGEHIYTDKVVKDKNITRLGRGEAIVGLSGVEPFIFKFERYVPRKP